MTIRGGICVILNKEFSVAAPSTTKENDTSSVFVLFCTFPGAQPIIGKARFMSSCHIGNPRLEVSNFIPPLLEQVFNYPFSLDLTVAAVANKPYDVDD